MKFVHLGARWISQKGSPASRRGEQLLSLNEAQKWQNQNYFGLQMPIPVLLLQLLGEMGNQTGFWGEKLHFLQSAREMESRPQNHWILSEYSKPGCLQWHLLIAMI